MLKLIRIQNYINKIKNKKKKDSSSHTGNRTRATAVRAPDPNH